MTEDLQELKPWDKQKNEPIKGYSYFSEFLLLKSQRSLSKLRAVLSESDDFSNTPTVSNLQNISARWKWFERAEAYDLRYIEERRQSIEQAYLKRTMDRIEENQEEEIAIHEKIMEALEDPDFADNLSKNAYGVRELSTAKNNVTQSQRLDLGEPTIIQRTDIDAKVKDDKKDVFTEINELKNTLEMGDNEGKV